MQVRVNGAGIRRAALPSMPGFWTRSCRCAKITPPHMARGSETKRTSNRRSSQGTVCRRGATNSLAPKPPGHRVYQKCCRRTVASLTAKTALRGERRASDRRTCCRPSAEHWATDAQDEIGDEQALHGDAREDEAVGEEPDGEGPRAELAGSLEPVRLDNLRHLIASTARRQKKAHRCRRSRRWPDSRRTSQRVGASPVRQSDRPSRHTASQARPHSVLQQAWGGIKGGEQCPHLGGRRPPARCLRSRTAAGHSLGL